MTLASNNPQRLIGYLIKKPNQTRITEHLDNQQPREKAGFCKNYSIMDHIGGSKQNNTSYFFVVAREESYLLDESA